VTQFDEPIGGEVFVVETAARSRPTSKMSTGAEPLLVVATVGSMRKGFGSVMAFR
jgi:hypothetical protein